MDLDAHRRQLRAALQARRAGICARKRRRATRCALSRLSRLACFRHARRIGIYRAIGSEIDPAGLRAAAGQRFFFPVLASYGLRFAADNGRLRPNRYGIPEPVGSRRIPPAALDLVIVPLVGFDTCGNRLGTGGGYYDRSYAFRLSHPRARPQLVGLAFACQGVARLPAAAWDVPLDLVVTEDGLHPRTIRGHFADGR